MNFPEAIVQVDRSRNLVQAHLGRLVRFDTNRAFYKTSQITYAYWNAFGKVVEVKMIEKTMPDRTRAVQWHE